MAQMQHDAIAPWASPIYPAPDHAMTAADLESFQGEPDRYELVQGRIVRMPPTGGGHGDILLELGSALRAHVRAQQLGIVVGGEVGFILSKPDEPETVLAPDIAFVRAERAPAKDSPEWTAYWRLAPDLAVEIVSPSQYGPEMARKAEMWIAAGTRLVWVIWPGSRHVDVWKPTHDRTPVMTTLNSMNRLDGQEVVPGFTYSVAHLFL